MTFVISKSLNAATIYTGGNFTLLDTGGNPFGGTNDVSWTFDNTLINTAESDTDFNGGFASTNPLFGFNWNTHDLRVFGEGTYSFDTGCTIAEVQTAGCIAGSAAVSGPTLSMIVGPNQLGAHFLFDYQDGNPSISSNIDVVLVWNQNAVWNDHGDTWPKNALWNGPAGTPPNPLLNWELVSTDADGDGINGNAMLDGSFTGFSANFSFGQITPVPVPAAIWLFGSGLLGLTGLARHKAR